MTLLDFVPILIFPLELKKEINRPLRLLNRTDEHVAFKVKTGNSKKFNVKPISGVVAPRSTCSVVVTLLAQKELPADMQCKDEFVIQSTITKAGISPSSFFSKMFSTDSGHIVEEQKFRAAYVLPIKPASSIPEDISDVRETSSSKDFKSEVGILFGENVREMTVIIKDGDGTMKKLLQRSLVSLTPLSDVLLQQREEKTKIGNEIRSTYSAKREDTDARLPEIKIKIVKSIMHEKVLYAEARSDFVNLLFNLLTYHVGSFSSLLQGHPITCFRSLCQSIKNLETAEYFKCERCKSRLLSPELPHKLCQSVFKGNVQDPEGTKDKKVRDYWYGFVKEGYTFMVTDDLNVTPMSGISVLSALREINSTVQEVQECEVKVGRKEAEDLVMASMTSKMALTRTFLRR